MSSPRNIVLLGATGSIGESTLSVIRKHPDQFRLLGAASHTSAAALEAIGKEFSVPHLCLFERNGLEGLVELATLPDTDCVIVATTGTIGVHPTIEALKAGKVVGLANKETLVLAGEFVMREARASAGRILPVDSEHNAVFQCLEGRSDPSALRRILLTASGGPFLHHTRSELEAVTLAEALKHPNWDMGMKVTVDSATMANKGLEMIEARWLFDLQPRQISIVIHPQSLVHSMVEFIDGSVIAQLAPPSMTFPIQHVLSYPERLPPCAETLDFEKVMHLEFRPPDYEKFPSLKLARMALESGGIVPAVFNVANEQAVAAFVENRIPFLAIPRVVQHCMEEADFGTPDTLEELLQLEKELRRFAQSWVDRTADTLKT